MSLKPTTAFSKIAELTKPIRLVRGGTSSSKTYSILMYLIFYGFNRELTINIIGATLPMMKKGVYKDFIKILKELGFYDDKYHNRTDHAYTLNKTTFQFFTGEEPSKLRGIRGDISYFNEANLIPFESYSEASSRTKLFCFCDWNPTAIFWADIYLVGQDDVDFITLTYKDNEFLEPKIVADIESWEIKGRTNKFFANKWLVMGLGQLGKQEGAIYTDWEEIEFLPKEAVLIGSGLDFGFTNDPTSLVSVYKFENELIVDEIIYEKGLSNAQISKYIKASDAIKSVIYADCSSPQNISDIKSYGIHILPVIKGAGSINYGIGLIQEHHFKVTKRSVNLIKELNNYTWSIDKLGNSTNEPIDNWNHALDALRYFFRMKFSKKVRHFNLKWKR